MKKLSKLKLKNFTEMNESEMKSVVGGYDLPEVYVYGTGGGGGTCGILMTDGTVYRKISKAAVDDQLRRGGVQNWCCDSCASASWY